MKYYLFISKKFTRPTRLRKIRDSIHNVYFFRCLSHSHFVTMTNQFLHLKKTLHY